MSEPAPASLAAWVESQPAECLHAAYRFYRENYVPEMQPDMTLRAQAVVDAWGMGESLRPADRTRLIGCIADALDATLLAEMRDGAVTWLSRAKGAISRYRGRNRAAIAALNAVTAEIDGILSLRPTENGGMRVRISEPMR